MQLFLQLTTVSEEIGRDSTWDEARVGCDEVAAEPDDKGGSGRELEEEKVEFGIWPKYWTIGVELGGASWYG